MKSAFARFLLLALVHALVAGSFVASRTKLEVLQAAQSDQVVLHQVGSSLEAAYQRGAIQLGHLDTFMASILQDGTTIEDKKNDISAIFLRTVLNDPRLDQARLLSASGMELVRVNREDSTAKLVPESDLQDKSDRAYFKDARHLEAGAIFVSDLDLNIEDGAVQYPLKPTVRLARPYRDLNGTLIGVVVLNLRPGPWLSSLVGRVGQSNIYLLDSHGHWLFGAGEADFSHITGPNGSSSGFSTLYPEVWNSIASHGDGFVFTSDGYFQYLAIDPLSDPSSAHDELVLQGGDAGLPFLAVAHIPARTVLALSPIAKPEFWILNLAVLTIIGFAVLAFRARQQAQQDLLAALTRERDVALQADKFRKDFLAKMSHDLRTPLNGVLGILDLVVPTVTEPKLRKELGLVLSSGRLLERLVEDLLEVVQFDQGARRLRRENFSPLETARTVQSAMSLLAEQSGTQIVVACEPTAKGLYFGDQERVAQILFNLVGNAVKFTTNGEISICIHNPKPGWIDLEVSDDGIGMEQSEIDAIFERLRTGQDASVPTLRTSGLGLHIIWMLTQEMGGTFDLYSTPGIGTQAHVLLPLEPAEPDVASPVRTGLVEQTKSSADVIDFETAAERLTRSEMPTSEAEGLPSGDAVPRRTVSLQDRRALVADDIPTNQLVLSAMLANLGISVTMVNDGAEAVARWQPGTYDIVLLDIMMPNMGGVEALAAIREKAVAAGTPEVIFVAVTANALPEQLEAYRRAGFSACVTKPISTESLRDALTKILK